MYRSKQAGRPHRLLSLESLEQRQLCVASLSVELAINGQDASSPPGPSLEPGTTAELTYLVTNTGDVPQSNVAVLDDNRTPGNVNDDFSPSPVLTTPIARGTLAKTFPGLNALKFLEHPTLPYVYATIMSTHSLAVINTQTLTVEANVPLGSNSGPLGMAISNDGTRLYIGMVFANKISVIDTATNSELPSIPVGSPVADVEVGADGRLFVVATDGIRQIHPQTGALVGPVIASPVIPGMFPNRGTLAMSPDKTHLYYGDENFSPSIYKINVTNSAAPALVWRSSNGPAQNGRDLELTRDGNHFSFVSHVSPTNEFAIAKQRTSDQGIVGSFVTGPAPEELVYSPSGAFAYTSIGPPNASNNKAMVWDATTFAQVGEIMMPGVPHEMFIPRDGRYLFASVDSDPAVDSLYVYETGRTGNRNVGDLNENNLLDPGETWTYRHQINVQAGQFAIGLSAIGIANGSEAVTANTTAYFNAVAPFAEVAAQAAENVMGLGIAQLPPDPYVGPVTISDNRFLVNGPYLDLKPDQFLTVAEDDGLVVEIHTVEASPRLLFRVTIDVVANVRPWHKPFTPQDVDGDNHIVPRDALIIINHLHAARFAQSSELGARPNTQALYLDVNADGHLTAADALMIINWLHANPVSSGGEGEDDSAAVPGQQSGLLLSVHQDEPQAAAADSYLEEPAATPNQPPAQIAADWVFGLIGAETPTSRSRRAVSGASGAAAGGWPNDASDDCDRTGLH